MEYSHWVKTFSETLQVVWTEERHPGNHRHCHPHHCRPSPLVLQTQLTFITIANFLTAR